jgi:hypothetical protein
MNTRQDIQTIYEINHLQKLRKKFKMPHALDLVSMAANNVMARDH